MTKSYTSPKDEGTATLVNTRNVSMPVKKSNGAWILLSPKGKLKGVNPDNYPALPQGVVLK